MPTTDTRADRRATLFVRRSLPKPALQSRQTTVARLEDLVVTDALSEFSVESWEKRVPLEGSDGRRERSLYNDFAAWAREAGVRLSPFFDTRECYSMETGERRRELVLPVACLAIYEDDELVRVAPHASPSGTESITECLDRLDDAPEEDRSERMTATAD